MELTTYEIELLEDLETDILFSGSFLFEDGRGDELLQVLEKIVKHFKKGE